LVGGFGGLGFARGWGSCLGLCRRVLVVWGRGVCVGILQLLVPCGYLGGSFVGGGGGGGWLLFLGGWICYKWGYRLGDVLVCEACVGNGVCRGCLIGLCVGVWLCE